MKTQWIKSVLWYLCIGILLVGMISCELFSHQDKKKEGISTFLLKPLLDSVNKHHKNSLTEEPTFNLKRNIIQGAQVVYEEYQKQMKDIKLKKKEITDSLESMN